MAMFRKQWLTASLVVFGALMLVLQIHAANTPAEPGAVWVFSIDDAIGPATRDYLLRGIQEAEAANAALVVIEMNTPGGLDASMRDIISAILASRVPVASFVTPGGARAASAGTYILYASHFAAMSEATNLGAATPVQIGTPSLPSPPTAPTEPDGDNEPLPEGTTAMERKMINDAAAYIRGLAELRGRNAVWAERAVREGVSLSAHEALEQQVVDLVAPDLPGLLQALDQKSTVIEGREIVLNIADAEIHYLAPDWRTELLATITNPNVVLILGMFGIYGIILEFYNPGSLVPGVVGVICLILAGYALNMLPVNYAGLALIVVGLAMMVAEALLPSFGALGIGGIIAFSIGGIMLFDTDIEAFQIGVPMIAAIGVLTALFIVATITIAMRVRKQAVTTGVQTIIGQRGEAMTRVAEAGQVRIGGEIWKATARTTIEAGKHVRVTSVDGLVLTVEPADQAGG
ncbi:MAG: nodulation protein NfeD [Pseudomonadota bacterium]